MFVLICALLTSEFYFSLILSAERSVRDESPSQQKRLHSQGR